MNKPLPKKRGPYALKFASTEQDIVYVYEHGPQSCLSNKASYYLSAPLHPVSVLAAGDIEVAYLEDKHGIAARTLIWRDRLVYLSSIYADWGTGTAPLLEEQLERRGFKDASHDGFDGARLLKRPITLHPPRQEHPTRYGIWPCWCFECQFFRLGRSIDTFVAPGIDCTITGGISVGDDYLYVGRVAGLPNRQPDHDKGVLL